MKIKTKVQAGIFLCIMITVTAGLFITMTIQEMEKQRHEATSAAKIVKDVAELKIVMHEYLLHPEERSLIQWKSKYNLLSKKLIENKNKFDSQDEKIILSRIHHEFMQIGIIFEELSRNFEKDLNYDGQKNISRLKFEGRLKGELLVRTHAMIFPVFQLQQIIQAADAAIHQKAILLIVVLLVLFAFLVTGILFWIHSSVVKPIAKLEEGTRIIGSGNLNHKVGTDAKDEIGQLSRAFDKMTEALQITTVSKNYVDNIIDSMMDTLIVVTPEGIIQKVNQATCDLLGYQKEDLIGQSIGKILLREEVSELLKNGVIKEIETRYLAKNGSKIPVLFSGSVMQDQDSNILGIVCVALDITEQKRLQEEVLKAHKLESLGVLAGGIAHDFNNLLQVVSGNISLAEYDLKPEIGMSESLRAAEDACLKVKKLTARLITFSKGGDPIKGMMPIDNLLKETVVSSLQGSNIKSTVSIPDDIRPVNIDEGQIKQVIRHIVINAKAAMADNGHLKVSCENIEISKKDSLALNPGNYIKISFKDQGCGISKENLGKIFDPYFSTKDMGAVKGQGLGLTVSYSIIKRHGGVLTVASELGTGTTLSVYLPVILAKEPDLQRSEGNPVTRNEGSILGEG